MSGIGSSVQIGVRVHLRLPALPGAGGRAQGAYLSCAGPKARAYDASTTTVLLEAGSGCFLVAIMFPVQRAQHSPLRVTDVLDPGFLDSGPASARNDEIGTGPPGAPRCLSCHGACNAPALGVDAQAGR